jgi:hypothetical protein
MNSVGTPTVSHVGKLELTNTITKWISVPIAGETGGVITFANKGLAIYSC